MADLVRGYGRGLVAAFFAAVVLWGALLIVLPQVTMLDRALTTPKRQLDSSIAEALAVDAATCISVIERYLVPTGDAPAPGGGLAIPSIGGAGGGLATPSIGGAAAAEGARPYVLQCDRATTTQRLVRDAEAEPEYLDALYGLPALRVDEAAPLAEQIGQAREIGALASDLAARLRAEEADRPRWSLGNFEFLVGWRAIPMAEGARAADDASLESQIYDVIGLRHVDEAGTVHKRLTLITLIRTIFFAVAATVLALVVCYPIAYNLALASSARKATWLFVGLVVPYAIVELMRVYAWVSLIETNGLINAALDWIGAIDIAAGEAIQFKRSPVTVFVVIVYTYILFMVFPMVNVMSTLDRNQIEAARDLGASAWRVHRRVVIPHAKPGIAVGCITTFMLAAGAFSVPRIVSRGLQSEWFSQTIYNKFFESDNSNLGAASSFAYTLICFAIVGLFMWIMRARLQDFVRA